MVYCSYPEMRRAQAEILAISDETIALEPAWPHLLNGASSICTKAVHKTPGRHRSPRPNGASSICAKAVMSIEFLDTESNDFLDTESMEFLDGF